MTGVNKVPHLVLKRVDDPESKLVSKRVADLDPADHFELVITDGNGNSVAYPAPQDKMRSVLIKLLHRLDRYAVPGALP